MIKKISTMVSRENVLILFDVDGTLTKPRQIIKDDLRDFLIEKVKPLVSIALVSGSDVIKIDEQMSGSEVSEKFDYVFCENGLVHYQGGKLISAESFLKFAGEEKLQKFINHALGYLSKIELPAKRGNFVEFRTSMINVSPVGRSCSQEVRDAFVEFDEKHGIRKKMIADFRENFKDSGLEFALGGQISVDIYPKGWDKTFCLGHVADRNFKEIHFFGDRTDLGGNDYEIFNDKRTTGHKVTSPEDTKSQLIQLLNIK